jgi:hypothetical protein
MLAGMLYACKSAHNGRRYIKKERGKERERERKRDGERGTERERGREKEGWRERFRERWREKEEWREREYRIVIVIFNRNEGCLGTF